MMVMMMMIMTMIIIMIMIMLIGFLVGYATARCRAMAASQVKQSHQKPSSQTTHRLMIHGYRFRCMASGVEEVDALKDRLQKKWMTKARWTAKQWRSAVRKIIKPAKMGWSAR